MSRQPRNLAASVRDRLVARSRERGEDFQFVLQHYGAERFLYRLGESAYRDRFVLKGAMLFALWGGSVYRPTRDLDFTGYGSSETEAVLACFREIFVQAVEDDGLIFDASTLAAEPIRDDAAYDGLRVKFTVTLGQARIHMQIDVGFGNVIEPPATEAEYPTLLDAPAPRIRAYPQEAVVAEKLHAMVLLGERNGRLKDFYDLYVLTKEFPFDGRRLAGAITATFERRRTAIDVAQPAALAPRFFSDETRAAQWRAYADRNRLPGAPADFDAVGERLRAFLGPPWSALAENAVFGSSWQPGGPWESEEARLGSAATSSPRVRRAAVETRVARAAGGVASGAMVEREERGFRRLKPYPAYKAAGAEWLGEIPAHWEVKRLKYVAPVAGERWVEAIPDLPYVGLEHLESGTGKLAQATEDTQSEDQEVESTASTFRPGDVLFGKLRPYLAKVFRPDFEGRCSTELLVLRSAGEIGPAVLAYQLLSPGFVSWINSMTYGTKMPRANAEQVTNTQLALPPAQEQRAIAAFLDRETARIDALVAKKERLIELLQEKRTALITQAVTKGLDPNVPMKDSGIEWLGEIPAHWEVKKLTWLIKCLDGRRIPLNAEERGRMQGEYPYWGANSIVDYVDKWLFDEELVLLGEDGAPFFERTKPVAFRVSGKIWVNNHAHVLRPRRKTEAAFLAHALNCVDYRAFIDGTTRDKLTQGDMNAIPIQCPEVPEQRVIAAFLERETAKLDGLVAKVRDAIDRLKELRTALISAAVTGKIDVREHAT